jgi:serine/threonine protein kinase
MNNVTCEKDKVINPKTGRCVNKSGKIGKSILSDKIMNPTTGRFVMKTGKIGKEIIKQSSPIGRNGVPVKVMKKIENIIGDCNWKKSWKKGKRVGEGSVGCVYSACGTDGCNYIIKIQQDNDEFRTEVDILSRINGWVHAPKIYGVWKCDGIGYIVEEKLEKIKYTKAVSYGKIRGILDELHNKFRIVFPDSHGENIMMRADGTIVLIDFGWAEHFKTKNSKTTTETWLTDKLGRPATLKEMVLWETVNLTQSFGSKEQRRIANKKLKELK